MALHLQPDVNYEGNYTGCRVGVRLNELIKTSSPYNSAPYGIARDSVLTVHQWQITIRNQLRRATKHEAWRNRI